MTQGAQIRCSDNQEGWDGMGGGREATYEYSQLIHVDVWQRSTIL